MNWLRRLFGLRAPASAPPPGAGLEPPPWHPPEAETVVAPIGPDVSLTVTTTVTGHTLEVVGESHHQEALQQLKASRPDAAHPVFTASLFPDQRFQEESVGVFIEPVGRVGYLSSYVAFRYRALVLQHPGPTTCPARLTGGTPDKPSIGVLLDLSRSTGAKLPDQMSIMQTDQAALSRWHELRNATTERLEAARSVETSDLTGAIALHEEALAQIDEYERLAKDKALFREPRGASAREVRALDRLTLCLIRADRPQDAVTAADGYFARYPAALRTPAGERVVARINKLRGRST